MYEQKNQLVEVDIVSFDGWISWDTTGEVVNIQSSAFPSKPSTQIPAVKITIKLNEGYTAIDGTNKLLSFVSGEYFPLVWFLLLNHSFYLVILKNLIFHILMVQLMM